MSRREPVPARVLVVDDELQMAEMLADSLCDAGYAAMAIASSEHALKRLRQEPIDALVTDLRMPKVDGLELLSIARRQIPDLVVIVMTAYGAIDSAIESIRQGAYHYLTKPFKLEELALFLGRALDEVRVRREAQALRSTLRERFSPAGVLGDSAPMREVLDVVERVATSDVPVLVVGETGTGKGLVARAIHAHGPRASAPFVTLNCAAVPEPLLESELFGHVRGAFTGATRDRTGLFAEADGGTLFLDEIGETSPALQAKLLDAIERSTVRAVGATREQEIDVRIVAATHRSLADRVRTGAFREDLRYRLEVVSIELPPLRRRRDDIPILVEAFLKSARQRHPAAPVERLSRDAMERLLDHAWPGNVRELSHVIERIVLLGKSAEATASDLPASVVAASTTSGLSFSGHVIPIRDLQRDYAAWALEQFGGHKTRTAEQLGVDIETLANWLSEPELIHED